MCIRDRDPSRLTSREKAEIFGDEADIISTIPIQQELDLNGDGKGNGNGKPKHVRKGNQIDLAFVKSHEFSVLLSHGEAAGSMAETPYCVWAREKGSEGKPIFETDELLKLRDFLLEIGRKGMSIQRYKGLGEMNPHQLLETTMDPANRTLLQVQAEDEVAADDLFVTLMGDLVEPRKEFIEKHAPEVQNLDI